MGPSPPPEAALRLLVRGDAQGVRDGLERVRSFLGAHGIERDDLARLMVIADELAANVAAYAWPGVDGPGELELALTLAAVPGGMEACLVMEDDGIPFDPTVPRAERPDRTLEDAGLGGAGLRIVSRFSDRFSYRRQDGRNRVTVAKKVRPAPG